MMVKKPHNMMNAARLRILAGSACSATFFLILGAMAGDPINLLMEDSSINFHGTQGWSYQLKGKESLLDSSWHDVGAPISGTDEGVSMGSPYGENGFFIVEANYTGGGIGFDFSQAGEYRYTNAVYGSTEPSYRYVKDSALYVNITPGYEIERSVEDVSAFLYPMDPIPLNGLLRIPEKEEGAPPSPLAIIVHGMSGIYESEKGFIYLCEQLASHGVIAATIDEYIFNDERWGMADGQENDARAIVLLEHVKQFGIWNETPGHPLEGKVDMQNVMLIGHSRGGEAVELASYFQSLDTNTVPLGVNTDFCFDGRATNHHLGPYDNFNLKALVALAPTEGTGINGEPAPPIEGNYLLMQGSADEDTTRFGGYKVYEQANPIDLDNPQNSAEGFKALVWIHGANHSSFNSEWGGTLVIDEDLQRKIAKYYITAFARSTLFADDQAVEVFQDNRIGDEFLVSADEYGDDVLIKRVTQYQGREHLFINHYQEDEDSRTLSCSPVGITGTNRWANAAWTEEKFSSVAKIGDGTWKLEDEPDNFAAYCKPGTDSDYTICFDAPLDVNVFSALSLNIANTEIDSENDLDVNIVMIDTAGSSLEFDISNYASLWAPSEARLNYGYLPITVLQTVFIPIRFVLEADGDFDSTALKAIQLKISDSTSGSEIYFDNLQLIK